MESEPPNQRDFQSMESKPESFQRLQSEPEGFPKPEVRTRGISKACSQNERDFQSLGRNQRDFQSLESEPPNQRDFQSLQSKPEGFPKSEATCWARATAPCATFSVFAPPHHATRHLYSLNVRASTQLYLTPHFKGTNSHYHKFAQLSCIFQQIHAHWRDTGNESSVHWGSGTGEMLDRRDTGMVGCGTGGMQEKRDSIYEGCMRPGMQNLVLK